MAEALLVSESLVPSERVVVSTGRVVVLMGQLVSWSVVPASALELLALSFLASSTMSS
jgi:hypothetical protein